MFRTRLAVPAIVIAVLMAGCGDSDGGATTTTTVAQVTTQAPATTQAPTTTAAPVTTEVTPLPVMIAAANGEIEIPRLPTRIVSLSATHTEMLFAIGAGDQVVAVDAFSNYPPEAPTTDLNAFALNAEAILIYEPDLIVIDGDWDGTTVAALTTLEVPVLVLSPATDLEDTYTQITQLGEATGHGDEAQALVASMRTEIDEMIASLPPDQGARTFYHELDTTSFSVTSETFIGRVYGLLGLQNIADAAGDGTSGYPQLSVEYILQEDPDFIFLADTVCCGVNAESAAARPGWDALTAVQTGRVIELDDDIASRWGPRIVEFMEAVAEALAGISVGT